MRDVIVIGGSAGALQGLIKLVAALPGCLPASVLLVLHTSPDTPGTLPLLLGRHALPVAYARDREPLRHGRIYIAPPDQHLLLENGTVRTTHGPRENGFRPAVDPLFRTAANVHGPRVIGILLSGALDDGTSGLAVIKSRGGIAIVQHPDDALVTGMPLSAIRNVEIDHILPVGDMAGLLIGYANEPAKGDGVPIANGSEEKPDPAKAGSNRLNDGSVNGPPSVFTCPECGGSLWELTNDGPLRYGCHVGHAYGPETLVDGKLAALEPVLWTALRTLEENNALLRRMADRASAMQLELIAEGYRDKAREMDRKAETIREVLIARPTAPDLDVVTKVAQVVEQAHVPAPDAGEDAARRAGS